MLQHVKIMKVFVTTKNGNKLCLVFGHHMSANNNDLRNVIVDNSRVDKKRVAPKELIDIKKGFFKVPPNAGGIV